jgi:protein-S-isoprenylcysteine O-methyltransferase Ste14
LIVEGPYRVSRNPIYLAMVFASLGVALCFGAATAFLPSIALAIILHCRFVMPEEAGLRSAFGAAAEAYFSKTKRWI